MDAVCGLDSGSRPDPSSNERSVVLCKWQPDLARELLERIRVHVVLDEFDTTHGGVDEELLTRAASVHRVSSFTALEELATVGVSIRLQDPGVVRVVSFTEFSQLGAGYLAEILGIGHSVTAAVAARDKRLMKRLVAATGVATACFHSLPTPSDDAAVASLAERLEFPVVIKPVAGFGTLSTHLAQDAAELREICRSFAYESQLASRHLMVETFMAGEELHVDAYWGVGGPHFLFISRYFATRLAVQREECHQDGDELLSRDLHYELYAEVTSIVARIMAGIGVQETMIHVEMFRQADGRIVFSEIGTRVGGGWTHGLVGHALGRSVWAAFADLVIDGRTQAPKPDAPYLGVLHLRPDAPGRIVAIPSAEEAMAIPGVLGARVWHKPGDLIERLHVSDWVMFVYLGAETAEDFEALVKAIPRRLRVTTVPVEAA